MKVSYILRHFPLPSETFVINEIISLQGQGVDIHPISLFAPEKCQQGLMGKVQRAAYDLTAFNVYEQAQQSSFLTSAVKNVAKMELPERYVWYAALVADYVTANGIELLHAHFAAESALVAMITGQITGVPFTFTAHAYDIFMREKGASGGEQLVQRLRLLCEHAARIIAVSEFNKNHILRLTNKKYASKVEVVHCGIDPERFCPASRNQSDVVIFLCVGRLVEKKGYEYLLRAFSRANSIAGNLRLRIVGDGLMRSEMEELCRQLQLEDAVSFLGAVASETVQKEMRSADVFVLHSVTAANGDKEGIPVSLMEASATGLPLLSTRHSGISEVVLDGVTGFLTEERDIAGCANSMIALAASSDLRERMGIAGAALVREQFNLGVECEKLRKAFEQAICSREAAPASVMPEKVGDGHDLAASVIICTYNRSDLLAASIRAVQRQDFPPDRYEIIVVDNNSTDDTKAVVRDCAAVSAVNIRYIFENRQGLSYARNVGIANANGHLVAFVDDDIDVNSTWLRAMVGAFDDDEVAAAGGPIRAIWMVPRPDWLSDRWQGHFTVNEFLHARESGEYTNPNYPWGANMAFRKDIFDIAGMFPTDLGRVGKCLLSNEEIDLFRRIEASGKKIRFASDAVIQHKIPAERMRKTWLYHRTYWQGRSDAVIDTNNSHDLYRNLLQKVSFFFNSSIGSAFDYRCMEKSAFGYIYHVLTSEGGNGEFRRLRALKVLLRSLMAPSSSRGVQGAGEQDATPNRFTQELLLEKDAQIQALVNSTSWRITKPLRMLAEFVRSK